ncbi:DNA translocase FtsK [candidate division WWE3 bacterium]|nr:DNA translocase FtsK [candidate division WWE3 bacterium]
MAKRGRKKKFKLKVDFNLRPEVVKSIAVVVFFLLGALSLISFVAPTYTLNNKIRNLLLGNFGLAAYLIPLVFILVATFFIDALKLKIKDVRVFLGLLGLLIFGSGFFSLFCWRSDPFSRASAGKCGGLLGYHLLFLLNKTVSIYGAALILVSAVVISVLLLFNLSLNKLFEWLLELLQKMRSKKDAAEEAVSEDSSKESESALAGTISQLAQMSLGLGSSEEPPEESAEAPAEIIEPEEPEEPAKIEILPSYSEPQDEEIVMPTPLEEDDSEVTSLVPNLPYSDRVWQLPPLSLLQDPPASRPDAGNVKARAEVIENTLKSFGIDAEVKDIKPGPSVTQYALDAATGTKISKIVNLQYDLALALASPTGSVRIEAPIPGKSLVGIEVPNNNRVTVHFKSLLTSEPMKGLDSKLGIVLGKDVGGRSLVYDIGKMPHLLVAGATGSGKSVFLHSLLFSMLYRATPQEVKFVLVDPKRVEFTHYSDIPHLLTPVVTDIDNSPSVFKWAVVEMERRYKLFEKARARNIDSYNEKSGFQALPYIVIIVDELGEIMVADPAGVEKSIIRLAQLARATGIHLVLSVQRPSTNVITGLIKANIPCRVAFNVSSQVDSRVIIDQPGAEKLLGQGDMLFVPPDASKPQRLQGSLVTEQEISSLVGYLKSQGVEPNYKEEVFKVEQKIEQKNTSIAAGGEAKDELFDDAIDVCLQAGRGSASLLQRRLSVGYARAARILDELEAAGIVGPKNGSQPRDLLIDSHPNRDDSDDLPF